MIELIAYMRTLLRLEGYKVFGVLGLMVVLGCLEGGGLLLLLPMLAMLGITAGPEASPSMTTLVLSLLQALGLPLSLEVVLGLYVLIISMRAGLMRVQSLLSFRLQYTFLATLRCSLYAAISHTSWLDIARLKTAEITQAFTTDLDSVGQGTSALLSLMSTAGMILVYLALAVRLSSGLTAVVLACSAVLALALRHQHRRVYALGRTLSQARNALYTTVSEHMHGIKVAKSYGAIPQHVAQFNTVAQGLRQQCMHFSRTTTTAKMVLDVSTAVALSVMFYVAHTLLHMPATDLLLLVFLCARLLPQYAILQQHYQQFVHALPTFTAIMRLQQRCLAAPEPHQPSPPQGITVSHSIVCQQLWFRYSQTVEPFVLRDLTCTIVARQTTAIVGPSGAGKSTLADCLMGLLKPEQGTICVDGTPLQPYGNAAWRQAIGYVPQETFLFHDTVRANLLWTRPGASEAELRHALRLAAAEEFVTGLPQGLDTVLGDRGMRLSGGERQRLALARALIRRPQLLILDEATSALDTANEQRIYDALSMLHGQLTIVLITHRLSTARLADHLLILEAGQVLEAGPWEALWDQPDSRLRACLSTASRLSETS